MRQGQGSKRSRGRGGGRRNAPPRHQSFDSNGPSIRIRGNANQVYEKYLQLARDANTAGDRVTAENMFQHAEHYFRVLNVEERESQQARLQSRGNVEDGHAAQPPQPNRGNGAEQRHPQQQPRHEAQPPIEITSESEPESVATGEQPVRQPEPVESSEKPVAAKDAPQAPAVERESEKPATPSDKQAAD